VSALSTGLLVGTGCRNDVTPLPDLIVGNDVPPGIDIPAGQDVPPGFDMPVTGGDAPSMTPVPVTINQIEDATAAGHPIPGTIVTLTGVVATTPKAFISKSSRNTSCLYGVWVEDPAGGPNSGILVTAKGNPRADTGSSKCADANTMGSGGPIPFDTAVGDTLTVTGQYEEFYLSTSGCMVGGVPCTATASQITAPLNGTVMVTKTGTGTVPAPVVLSASEVMDLNALGVANATTNKYRNVLIEVDNVMVTCPNLGYGNDGVNGTAAGCMASGTTDGGAFMGGSSDGFYLHSQVGFAYTPSFTANETVSKIIGVLSYDQFSGHWLLLPRTNADVTP
jgi:hypothetical protein